MAIIFFLNAILLFSKPYVEARTLATFPNNRIQDIDYDTDLVGKYHKDIFHTLKQKYKEADGLPNSSHDILEDLKEVMIDYCPSHESQQPNSCIRDIIEHTENESRHKKDEAVTSILSDSVMNRLEHAMYMMDNKQDTLNIIESLKEEFGNDIKGKAGLTALSFAKESYSFWFDVYSEKDHPLNRRLQILDLPTCLAESLVSGVTSVVQSVFNGESTAQTLFTAISALVNFISTCNTSSPSVSHSDAPTKNPTATPTKSPTSTPTKNPTAPPTKSPTSTPTKNPTKNPTAPPTNSITNSTSAPTVTPLTSFPTRSIPNITNAPTKNIMNVTGQTSRPTAALTPAGTKPPVASEPVTKPPVVLTTKAPTALPVAPEPVTKAPARG